MPTSVLELFVSIAAIDPEIGQLVSLARSGSGESRSELYMSIARLMHTRDERFTPIERDLLKAIMAQLTRQVEMEVRLALAERMALLPDAPHDLILVLANDRIEVATSILERSTLLSEDELVDIINATSHLHQRAIAARPDVTPRIAASLTESSAIEVLIALVQNKRARIAADTMGRLAERSRDSQTLQHGVVERPELTEDLARRMCAFVSDALQGFICQRFDIDPEAIRQDLALASAEAHARLINASGAERLVDKLHAAGQLKAGFAVKALSQGQLDVFEHTAAKLAGVPVEAIGQMLRAGDPSMLALICRAIGIDRSVFATLYAQAEMLRGRMGVLNAYERSNADRVFQTLSREDAREDLVRKAA